VKESVSLRWLCRQSEGRETRGWRKREGKWVNDREKLSEKGRDGGRGMAGERVREKVCVREKREKNRENDSEGVVCVGGG